MAKSICAAANAFIAQYKPDLSNDKMNDSTLYIISKAASAPIVRVDSPVVLSRWKNEFLERTSEVFKKRPSASEKEIEQRKEQLAESERNVGQLSYEVDWLKKI